MGTGQPTQLEFSFLSMKACGVHRFVLTKPLSNHRLCKRILEKLAYAARYFPELREKRIRVGLTRAAGGLAVPGGDEVWFQPSRLSYHTIAHEFMHLLQGSNGIPTGERSCDVFSLARHWTLNDTLPNYVRIPASYHNPNGRIPEEKAKQIFTVASGAIERKNFGLRNYIAFFEKELTRLEK